MKGLEHVGLNGLMCENTINVVSAITQEHYCYVVHSKRLLHIIYVRVHFNGSRCHNFWSALYWCDTIDNNRFFNYPKSNISISLSLKTPVAEESTQCACSASLMCLCNSIEVDAANFWLALFRIEDNPMQQ